VQWLTTHTATAILSLMSFHRLSKDAMKPAAGRDIDAWCTRCKRELGHTITAMVNDAVVQVRCKTCEGVHKFRTPAAEKPKARAKTRSAKAQATVKAARVSNQVRQFQQRIADHDLRTATAYAPTIDPTKGQLIEHSKFGFGIVGAVSDDRAEVLFETGQKMLVIGR
jgi:hypothetical protein